MEFCCFNNADIRVRHVTDADSGLEFAPFSKCSWEEEAGGEGFGEQMYGVPIPCPEPIELTELLADGVPTGRRGSSSSAWPNSEQSEDGVVSSIVGLLM
jgi:hypothetical protein